MNEDEGTINEVFVGILRGFVSAVVEIDGEKCGVLRIIGS